ncbi:hypothetical protein D9757_004962 [Collybiopsis confluens]|uniref:Uncharacterized protein n=1 Tax=Collybiopsis confluens TaxID=2823264 RepID=A0A8H5MC81_9AGAR|nr:hypothetical protein D9757_004962 [Collybiopsis confluens]
MYWVDNDKVLKLFSYLIDVSSIVANMDLARTKLPVPPVLRYGLSGNCSWSVFLTPISPPLCENGSLGLSHNDLIPRNLLRVVDMSAGMITSIVDWDTCTPIFTGGEYARAVSEHSKYPASAVPGQQNIFLVLLRHRTGDEILLGCSDRNPARRRKWPLVTSKSSQIFSPPVTDPRYQSFSRQKIHPIHSHTPALEYDT